MPQIVESISSDPDELTLTENCTLFYPGLGYARIGEMLNGLQARSDANDAYETEDSSIITPAEYLVPNSIQSMPFVFAVTRLL